MKRHELDWVSLIAGAVFLLVAVTHLVGAASGDDPDLRWLLPAMLVGVGLAGLTGALRSSRPRPVPVADAADTNDTNVANDANVASDASDASDTSETVVLGEDRGR